MCVKNNETTLRCRGTWGRGEQWRSTGRDTVLRVLHYGKGNIILRCYGLFTCDRIVVSVCDRGEDELNIEYFTPDRHNIR